MSDPNLRNEVQSFLTELARALTAGDGRAVANLWEVPALVVANEGVRAVESRDAIAAFFGSAKDQYTARGIVDTHSEAVDLEPIGERIVIAKVRWAYADVAGKRVGGEASDYTLRRDDGGALKIRVVVMRGVQP